MDIILQPPSESALRALAERAGVSVERYASEALAAHVKAYDSWFVESVQKGLQDASQGRVLTPAASKLRDEARRAGLKN